MVNESTVIADKTAVGSWIAGDDNDNYSDLSEHSGRDKTKGAATRKKKAVAGRVSTEQDIPDSYEGKSRASTQHCNETATTLTDSHQGKADSDIAMKNKNSDPKINDEESHDYFEGDAGGVPDNVRLDRFSPTRTISNISVVTSGTSSVYGDGGSVCGASIDSTFSRSRSENIRARLRQQEKKLSQMVHRQANSETIVGDKFKQEMSNVKSNLDKVEQEKYALEQKLEFLKNQQLQDKVLLESHDVTDHDSFLRDKLNGIQRGFQEQASKIQGLENEITNKTSEIENYRFEIVTKLKRIVELEFDLEMHNIHYTDFSMNQFKLVDENESTWEADTQMAKSTGDLEKGKVPNLGEANTENATVEIQDLVSGEKDKLTPKRAQKLIAKLLRDLDHLEATYKKEKLKTLQTKERLAVENEDLRTRVQLLEKEQKNLRNKEGKGAMNDVCGYMSVYQLRRRVETLEAKRILYRKEMMRLQAEMKEYQQETERNAERHEREVSRLTIQLEGAKIRCETLMKEKDGNLDDTAGNQYAVIEQRIKENYEIISRLEAASEIKDRQIDDLKKEVHELRIHKIASGKGGSKYNQADAEVLTGELPDSTKDGENLSDCDDEKRSSNENISSSFVADLQKQLLMAHEQLVKKDQELVIERAKSACMAANLLDRIAELDKEAEKMKRRNSIQPKVEKESPQDRSYEREDSILSPESLVVDDPADGKRRKSKKTMSSRIPFRFNLAGGKKE